MLLWTELDEDTLERCRDCIRNCEERRVPPMPWFTLVLRMYQELERVGLLQRVVVRQEVCEGCVQYQDGCLHHYTGTHMDQQSGKVLFCPHKTTQTMREAQLKLHKKRKGRA